MTERIRVTTPFQLLQWKYAIQLEAKGLKHSRGSVIAHAARAFGLGPRAKRHVVLARVQDALNQCEKAGLCALDRVEIPL